MRTSGRTLWVALLGIGLGLPSVADPAPAEAPQPEPTVMADRSMQAVETDGADGASALVERFQAALLETMQSASTLGYEGRRDELAPVIRSTFDLPFMSRYSAGRHWKSLSASERDRLIEAFSRFAIAIYAVRFDGYSGERFEVLRQAPARQGTRLVRTRLLQTNGESVLLDYRLRADDDGWRIIDVFLNGTISELALRRAEYDSLIRRKGIEGLIQALEGKVSAFERDNSL